MNILITGSLWYGSNEEGIVWFLQEVYSKIDGNDIFLCIAGRNPSDRLKNICAQFNSVFLTDSPVDMKPLFEKANLYIAPIFDGAGMKVKIAEAMSYGLPVIGTDYAFVGYEIDNEKNAFLANTPEEFLQRIAFFRSIDSKKFVEYSEKAYQLYKNKYSMEASAIQWKTTIEKILEVTNDYY